MRFQNDGCPVFNHKSPEAGCSFLLSSWLTSKMDDQDVRQVVAEVLSEQHRLHNSEVDEVVLKTIATILTSFGIEEEDRVELRADFVHLRRWRKSVEQAQSLTFKVVATAIVTGAVGAFWLGVKTMLGK